MHQSHRTATQECKEGPGSVRPEAIITRFGTSVFVDFRRRLKLVDRGYLLSTCKDPRLVVGVVGCLSRLQLRLKFYCSTNGRWVLLYEICEQVKSASVRRLSIMTMRATKQAVTEQVVSCCQLIGRSITQYAILAMASCRIIEYLENLQLNDACIPSTCLNSQRIYRL